jgi:DNA-binding NtrC family response regulator
MLHAAGCAVRTAAGAEQALRALREAPLPQLLLSDVRLGDGISGVQLAQAVAHGWPQLRVALMSAMPDQALGTQPGWRDGWPFLQKPFDAPTLRAWLAGLSAPARPAVPPSSQATHEGDRSHRQQA